MPTEPWLLLIFSEAIEALVTLRTAASRELGNLVVTLEGIR